MRLRKERRAHVRTRSHGHPGIGEGFRDPYIRVSTLEQITSELAQLQSTLTGSDFQSDPRKLDIF